MPGFRQDQKVDVVHPGRDPYFPDLANVLAEFPKNDQVLELVLANEIGIVVQADPGKRALRPDFEGDDIMTSPELNGVGKVPGQTFDQYFGKRGKYAKPGKSCGNMMVS